MPVLHLIICWRYFSCLQIYSDKILIFTCISKCFFQIPVAKGDIGQGFFEKKKAYEQSYWSSHRRCSVKKKVFLEISQNSQEKTSARDSFLIKLQDEACNFIKKESLAYVFSCEFCEISKSTCGRLLLVLWAVQISLTNLQVSWRPWF